MVFHRALIGGVLALVLAGCGKAGAAVGQGSNKINQSAEGAALMRVSIPEGDAGEKAPRRGQDFPRGTGGAGAPGGAALSRTGAPGGGAPALSAQAPGGSAARADSPDAIAAALAASLDETELLSQLFLVNLEGNRAFRPVEFDTAGRPAVPGGYVLFSYNIAATEAETAAFTASIRAWCDTRGVIPPYLAVDHEGGSVNRLRAFPAGRLPSARETAARYTPEEARELYAAQGRFLRSLGIHLALAPVAEALTGANRAALDDRSYGGPEEAARYAESAVRGFQSAGVGAALKHFPGTGAADPHTGLSVITASKAELEASYIAPFRAVLASGARPAAAVMSHAGAAGVDGGRPACLSAYWTGEMLRGELGFTGVIISDDITMAALGNNGITAEDAAVRAIAAGADVIMLSEKRFLPLLDALRDKARGDEAFAHRAREAALRVLRFKAAALSLPPRG